MAESRSVKWKTMKKNHSSFFLQMLTVYAMMSYPKILSFMRWRIRNAPFVLWKEPKSLEEVFKIAEMMEPHARKVKPEGRDGFESKIKDLVEPFNVFQFHCDS